MLPDRTNLHIDIRDARLELRGDLDMDTAATVIEAARHLVDDGQRDVVVDCAGLTFCDSYGLRALKEVADLVGPEGSASISRPSATLTRILSITGLGDAFTITEDDPQPGTISPVAS